MLLSAIQHKKKQCVAVLLLCFSVMSYAQKNIEQEDATIVSTGPCSYSLTLHAKASKEVVWQLWEDVENWKSYDIIVKYSYLKDPAIFETGAIGYVKTTSAPKTRFELLDVQSGSSFTESLKLPLWNSLELKRRVVSIDQHTSAFTHEVEFKGPLKSVMYLLLAKTFKKELPLVMGRLRDLAEVNQAKVTQ